MNTEYESFRSESQTSLDKAISFFKDELGRLRSGKANILMVQDVTFDGYGQIMTIKQAAALSVPDPHQIVIEPWDKSLLKEIERGVYKSGLDFSVVNDGQILRVQVPPMTEARKKDLVKYAKGLGEDSKIVVRNIRRDANAKIKDLFKDLSEDELRKELDTMQKETDSYISMIEDILKSKEKDIMSI